MGCGLVRFVCLRARSCFLGLRFLAALCPLRHRSGTQPKGSVFRGSLPCGDVSAASTVANYELFFMCVIFVGDN